MPQSVSKKCFFSFASKGAFTCFRPFFSVQLQEPTRSKPSESCAEESAEFFGCVQFSARCSVFWRMMHCVHLPVLDEQEAVTTGYVEGGSAPSFRLSRSFEACLLQQRSSHATRFRCEEKARVQARHDKSHLDLIHLVQCWPGAGASRKWLAPVLPILASFLLSSPAHPAPLHGSTHRASQVQQDGKCCTKRHCHLCFHCAKIWETVELRS